MAEKNQKAPSGMMSDPETGKPGTMNFEQYAEEGNRFINEVKEALGTDNRNQAARVTRAVLQALRDKLPVEEAVHLSQQLPMALKGVFFDQYDVSRTPLRIRSKNQFFDLLRQKDHGGEQKDFRTEEDLVKSLQAVFSVLEKTISKGQIDQVKALMPADIMTLVDPAFQYPSERKTWGSSRGQRSEAEYGDTGRYADYPSRPFNYTDERHGGSRETWYNEERPYWNRPANIRDRDRDMRENERRRTFGDWREERRQRDSDYRTRPHRRDEGSWYDRGIDKVKEIWDDIRGRDEEDYRYDDRYSRRNYEDRRTRQGSNDWRERDEDRYYNDERRYRDYDDRY